MTQPRGIRNCNPGNIRLSGDKWKGLRPRQTDGEFCQFTDMAHGYRALIRLLQNYRKLHGCRNTAAYITAVCQKMQVPSTYEPDTDDRDTMTVFAAAISEVENGVPAQTADIRAGWELL